MAPRLTFKNIAILGLVQVGVVVFGVLGAGATHKAWTTFNMSIPSTTELVCEWGFLALAVPLLWITVAMVVQGRDEWGDEPEIVTAYTGVLVLLLLLYFALRASAWPWLLLFGSSHTLSS